MASKFGTWWQKIRHYSFIAAGIVVPLIAFIAFALAVHWWGWDWTGFNRYIGPELKPNQQYRPEKTLWDWLQLLIIPLVLAIGGFWFSQIQKSRDESAAAQRANTEREIAADNQRETTLQAYLDNMSKLLLHEKLHDIEVGDDIRNIARVRNIARIRTLTVLHRLDPNRKASVIQFLYEAGLIETGIIYKDGIRDKDTFKPIINLDGADLSEATLSGANLVKADLSKADLSKADLSGADLSNTDLSRANLRGANLSRAYLYGAEMKEADLTGASLTDADTTPRDTVVASFTRTNFEAATLRNADLRNANLRGADLSFADLSSANLSGALLGITPPSGFDLEVFLGFTIEDLEKQAGSLKGATMPDGSKHP